jgi:3-dehydroquinate synthase
MMLQSRQVTGAGFSYPVELYSDLLGLKDKLGSLKNVSKFIILTNRQIAGIYEKYLRQELQSQNTPFHIIYLKSGEKNKHIDRTKKIYHELVKLDADRKAVIIAFGGGVIGDFAGFIAATYQRGIRFVQIPTTLLACVDSSVGGKVAVNLDLGKNMIGAFYQPEFVFAPLFSLSTLPEREWSCGLAEIVKHAFLDGGDFLNRLETSKREDFHSDSEILRYAIDESVRFKSSVVAMDEREGGVRAILNLGHTTGHAIESLTKYSRYSHGEAVSMGLMTALLLSKKILGFSDSNLERAIKIMKALRLPTRVKEKAADVIQHMDHDKKKDGNVLKFVLLEDFGKPRFGVAVDRDTILETLKFQKGWDALGQ